MARTAAEAGKDIWCEKLMPAPEELDYDFWPGPAPNKPYNPERVHAKFRG